MKGRSMSSQDLLARLGALSENRGFDVYWHLRLARGEELSRGGDTVLPSASVRKVSVMMLALSAVHQGRLSLAAPVIIDEAAQQGMIAGVFQHMTPGLVLPLRDAILQMIITSDNVCTYGVMQPFEIDEFTAYCHAIGMAGTTHRTRLPPVDLPPNHALDAVTTTTARDQVLLFDLIGRGCDDAAVAERLGVTPELCRLALQFLCWQTHRDMIPALLPLSTIIGNKTGWGERGWMDTAIVFDRGAPLYTLSLTTDNVPETMPNGLPGYAAAKHAMAEISRACWDALRHHG
jgi:beta-lactamase class A